MIYAGMMKDILPYLSCFAAVCSTGSISDAAKALGITQPSASRQIRELEAALGVDLFVRERQGARLSKSGKKFADDILPLFKQMSQAIDVTSSGREKIEGMLRIGCLTEIGQSYLFGRLLDFRSEYSGIELRIEYLKEAEIIEHLKSEHLDFGVITAATPPDFLSGETLRHERIIAVCRTELRRDLQSIEDLQHAQFVAYRNEDPLLYAWISSAFGKTLTRRIKIPVAVNSHRSMIDCLYEMDAYAVMPWHSVEHLVEAGVLRVAASHELSGPLQLVWVPSPNERRRRIVLRDFLLPSH